jgi:chorismate-pyruvate lyase
VNKEKRDIGGTVIDMIAKLERKAVNLSQEQKILLAETGTLEQILSIITGSPVEVKVINQSVVDDVIRREVHILTKGRALVHARSKIYCNHIPTRIVRKIMQQKHGIGTIIHNEGLETCRRFVRFGLATNGRPYRVYRIIHKGKTAFEIREDILI